MAWTTLVVQIGIVVTGGAVRLTASGLGCPTWPQCTDDSLITTPEMGIHGVIEFGNRLLTFVLALVAILTFLAVVRLKNSRPELFWIALVIGLGIPAQAVIGGISVWVKLNPYVVGLHFVLSIALIVLSSVLLYRVSYGASGRTSLVSPLQNWLLWVMAIFQAITIGFGILTTGSGPHAGDAQAPRNGLDSEALQHVHSFPAYVALLLTFILIALNARPPRTLLKPLIVLLLINVAQAAVGILQSHLGLPPLLVAIHMLLACVVAALVSWLLVASRSVRAEEQRKAAV